MLTLARSAVAATRPACRARACCTSRKLTVGKAQLRSHKTASSPVDLSNGGLGSIAASLAALAPLTLTAMAHADEAVTDVTTAATGGFGAGEAVLLATPLFIYALFNLYRDRVNPEAKFLDYIYIMVFLAIVANLVSIVVFKVRFF